jgi:hypothetical protein
MVQTRLTQVWPASKKPNPLVQAALKTICTRGLWFAKPYLNLMSRTSAGARAPTTGPPCGIP